VHHAHRSSGLPVRGAAKSRRPALLRGLRAAALVVAALALLALASGCGGANDSAYLGSWLATSGQGTAALRVTDVTGRVLVDYLDLTRSAQDQTVFSTQADVNGDALHLEYESAGGQIVKGGTLRLSQDGQKLVWVSGSGKRSEFRTVTVLPAPPAATASQ